MDSNDSTYEKLTAEELVEYLNCGSKAIDRMRTTINNVVGTILGLLSTLKEVDLRANPKNTAPENETFFIFNFVSEDCVWTYSGSYNRPGEIYCSWEAIPYSSNAGASKIALKSVAAVHKALAVLTGGVRDTFPEIQLAWKPLLNAARDEMSQGSK